MISRRIRIAVPLLALLLATVAALAPPAAAQSKSDKAILKAGVITKNDIPTGWTSKKATSSDSGFKGVSECKALKSAIDNAKKNAPRAQSRKYQEPRSRGTTSAENSVYAFKSVSAAEKFLDAYEASQTCIEKATAKAVKSNALAGEPSVSPVMGLDGVGDRALGYETTIPFSVAGQSVTIYLDTIAVRVGRAFVGFNFSNLDGPISDGPAIVRAVLGRVAAAQGSA
jgi:hypothetical protein